MTDSRSLKSLFERLHSGDESARTELFTSIYAELHRLARAHMAQQRPSHTLQPTALVNEAFMKLCAGETPADRHRFLNLASTAMRQILVDHARRKSTSKRGGNAKQVELDSIVTSFDERSHGLIELDAALERLRLRDPDLVKLVELRFFGGRSHAEAAELLGISPRQATRWWQTARAYLKREIDGR